MADRTDVISGDVQRLHAMGYAQELRRAMGLFSNFAISFTIISILTGALTLFSYGYGNGGPLEEALGWPIITIFTLFVALAMAELASAFPTAGALYYYASKLGGPAWGYYTGWFNLVGQLTITAGIDYGCAVFATPLLGLSAVPAHVLPIYAVILLTHGALNHFGTRVVSFINSLSAWWHVVGALLITVALFAVSRHPVSYAFTNSTHAVQGFPYWYLFMIGLLQAQWTFTGYDASAHVSEETVGAEHHVPRGIVLSVVVSGIFGYAMLMALTLAAPHYASVMASSNPVIYIIQTRLGLSFGTFIAWVVTIAMWYCGLASVTSNSRMIYAFSRDGALPWSQFIHRIDKRFRIPANAIWIAVIFAFLPMLAAVYNSYIYSIITSISVIGLYVAYVIPVYLGRRAWGKTWTEKGSFNLGKWSAPVAWIAIVWVVVISIVLMLPETAGPITLSTLNWALPSILLLVVLVTIAWRTSVRHWFHGAHAQGSLADLEAIEQSLGGADGVAAPVSTTD